MIHTVEYNQKVVSDDIPNLPKNIKKRIQKAIASKLVVDPLTFGVPLRRSLKNYRKLRVGNYRIIFKIEDATVGILAIMHRSVVYDDVTKRL